MSWNYRIFRGTDESGQRYYEFREAYYDEPPKISGWTSNPSAPVGETFDELVNDLAWMLAGLTKPILDVDTGLEVEPAKMLEDDLMKWMDANGKRQPKPEK